MGGSRSSSELTQSNNHGARSNLPVSTGRPLTPIFSGQSGSLSGFRHAGSLAPRGSSMTGSPTLGVQQPRGSISGAWFPSNSIPASIYQISHGYSALSNRGATPVWGNFGPRITTYVGNIAGRGNTGRTISSAGLSMPTVASPVNFSGSRALNIRGSNQMGGIHQQESPAMNMLGSSSSASGGALSKNQLQAGSSSSGSPGMGHDANFGENSPFDINDFPQLVGRPNSAGNGSLQHQAIGISPVQQNQGFRIHNEDFPELPRLEGMDLHRKDHLPKNANIMQAQHYPMGRSSDFNSGSSYPPRQQPKQTANSVQNTGLENTGPRPVNSPSSSLNPRPHEQVIQQNHEPQAQNSVRLQSSSGPEPHHAQSPKSSHGTDAAQDPYGLHGLLSIMKLKEEGPASLALGIDLTTLGLDMNSSDPLYKTFTSPWSSEPPVKEEYYYETPNCYSAKQPPPLMSLLFQKFHIVTLLYIFYSMPQDAAQLYAANQLYKYGWLFHKELRQWLKRVPDVTPLVQTTTYEQGPYIFFNPNIWDATSKGICMLFWETELLLWPAFVVAAKYCTVGCNQLNPF
uniref:NOT2/NOT3/NOT5 C-terminal domain-containing protein n=1 Tax=Oryza brachyantha TaxID=4533 RepID=J3M8A3_ORYBR